MWCLVSVSVCEWCGCGWCVGCVWSVSVGVWGVCVCECVWCVCVCVWVGV